MTGPVIALAADHAGFELKNSMKFLLEEHSFPLVDLGPETADPVDYPDIAGKLAAALKDGRAQQGLLVCGTGIGIAIAANRYPGSGPPYVTTSRRRVWPASTTTPTSLPSARA
jgi:ribose 5-phosphate isomerase B